MVSTIKIATFTFRLNENYVTEREIKFISNSHVRNYDFLLSFITCIKSDYLLALSRLINIYIFIRKKIILLVELKAHYLEYSVREVILLIFPIRIINHLF